MKTSLIKISFTFLLFSLIGVGCKKEAEPNSREIDFLKVKGLSLQGDSCFIINGVSKDSNFVINSQGEFEKYFDCNKDFSSQIDFTQYTLLAGSRTVSCIYPKLVLQQILVDDEGQAVQFKAQFEYDSGCYASFGIVYYHALVPKINNDYTVCFDIKVSPFVTAKN